MSENMRELPRYQCHKMVWALKIHAISKANPPTVDELEKILNGEDGLAVEILPSGEIAVAGLSRPAAKRMLMYEILPSVEIAVAGAPEHVVGAIIVPEDEGYSAFPVSREYVLKHNPQVGGYVVQYEDGYISYSPAKAFEEGYTRI